MAVVPSIGRASLVEPKPVAPEATATHGLYERHAAKIHSYCLHQLGSREEAEDAVQTTFMNAFRALRKGVVPEAEAAWLFKIAENVCLSRRRSSWRRGRIESPADFEVIEEVVPGPNRQRDELIGIEDALANMPEQQRRAILLREWQGLSYREIADELDVSQSAVETLIFRARRSLAHGLEEPGALRGRHGLRRVRHLADVTTLLAAAKSFLFSGAAVQATATAVAVTVTAGAVATVTPRADDPRRSALVPPTIVAPAGDAAAGTSPGRSHIAMFVPNTPRAADAPARPEQRAAAVAVERASAPPAVRKPEPKPAAPAARELPAVAAAPPTTVVPTPREQAPPHEAAPAAPQAETRGGERAKPEPRSDEPKHAPSEPKRDASSSEPRAKESEKRAEREPSEPVREKKDERRDPSATAPAEPEPAPAKPEKEKKPSPQEPAVVAPMAPEPTGKVVERTAKGSGKDSLEPAPVVTAPAVAPEPLTAAPVGAQEPPAANVDAAVSTEKKTKGKRD